MSTRYLSLKVDFAGSYYDENTESVSSYSYTTDWMIRGGSTDMTSAIQDIKISKRLNDSDFVAVIELSLIPDNNNMTWEQKVRLYDTVTITVQSIDQQSVKSHVVFFGFIETIQNTLRSTKKSVQRVLVLQCNSIGTYLRNPFLNFDKLSDPLANLLKMDMSLWNSIQELSIEGDPSTIENELIQKFKSFIGNLRLHGNELYKVTDYIGHNFSNYAVLLPFAYGYSEIYAGAYSNDFWTAFSDIAEIYGGMGWMHEMYIDILPESKLNEYKEIFNVSSIQKQELTPTALYAKTSEPHYLCFFIRPNVFPYIDISDDLIENAVHNTFELSNINIESHVQYHNELWQKMLYSKTFVHEIDAFFKYSSEKNKSTMKSVFNLQMLMDQKGIFSWELPVVIDKEAYRRKGYDPLTVRTKYAYTKTALQDENAVDKNEIIENLFRMNLMHASFNAMQDIYGQGYCMIPLNFDISIGEICKIKTLKGETKYFYVDSVSHNINPTGQSHTFLRFNREMSEEDYKNLKQHFISRFIITQAMNLADRMRARGLSEQTVNYTKSLEKK